MRTPPRSFTSKHVRRFIGVLTVAAFAALTGCTGQSDKISRQVSVASAEALTNAIADARPGDTISILPGRYRTALLFAAKSSGTNSNPVTVTARDGPGTVTIDGAGNDITIKFNRSEYIELKALDITGGGYHGVFFDNGARNITVEGNRIYDNHAQRPLNSHAEVKGSGRKIPIRNITITNNEIFHSQHPPGGNFQGIDCNTCIDFVITGNYLHDIREPTSEPYSHYDRGSCIQMKSNSQNTVIERNRIERCHIGIVFGGDGVLRPSHVGGIVRNNVIHDSTEIGIVAVNASGGKIVHNTFFGNGESIRIARDGRFPGGGNQVDVSNNILGGTIRITGDYSGTTKTNVFLEPGMADQIFKNPSARDFRLKATASALIDRATDAQNEVPSDFDGKPRPYGPRADIGAFEYRPEN